MNILCDGMLISIALVCYLLILDRQVARGIVITYLMGDLISEGGLGNSMNPQRLERLAGLELQASEGNEQGQAPPPASSRKLATGAC